MAHTGPPIGLIAIGLILWLAVNATVAGISIDMVGIVLFASGVVWLILELVRSRNVVGRERATVIREEPVVREREVY